MTEEIKPPLNPTEILKSPLNPIVSTIPGGALFEYIEQDSSWPAVEIRDIMRNRAGDIVCELTAFCEEKDTMIPCTGIKFNLSSLTTRKQVAKALQESYFNITATWIDWLQILGDVSLRAIKLYRNGSEVEEISPLEDIPEPLYLLNPLLPLNHPTIVFGEGGAGKGHLSILSSIIAQLPYSDNSLGFTTLRKPTNVLYCDYESDRSDFERTLSGLCKGMGVYCSLYRVDMAIPIADNIEQLKNKVHDKSIGLLVIDSLAPASGGNINEAEPAIKLYSAIRQIPNITTLIIAHQSKDVLSRRKSVYGSVFFSNLARSVWELKRSQEPSDPELIMSLTNVKYNRKQQKPIGLSFLFDEGGTITVSRCDLSKTELSSELPIYVQMRNLLYDGSLSKKEIAESLSYSETTIKSLLYKYKSIFIPLEGGKKWGVIAE